MLNNEMEILHQGAESKIYVKEYLGQEMIIKERFPKTYRNKILDDHITKERIKAECRNTVRCKQAGIRTPAIFYVNMDKRLIYMEYFKESETVKKAIDRLQSSELDSDKNKLKNIMIKIGTELGKMHSNGIIHGDLTTSNILSVNNDLIFIDFGLSSCNATPEDKGVDLYVLERALLSTHVDSEKYFEVILLCYNKKIGSQGKEIMIKLEEVRSRGRKRTMVG